MKLKTVEFSADLEEFAKKLNANVVDATNLIGLRIWRDIIKMSPVDTGRFRASWNYTYFNEDLSIKAEGNYPNEPVAPGELNRLAPIFITNNLEYAPVLEAGHSKQAPQGMVTVALNNIQAQLQGFLS